MVRSSNENVIFLDNGEIVRGYMKCFLKLGGERENKLAILGFAPFNRFCRQSYKSGIHPVSLVSLRGKMVMMSTLVHCLLWHFDTPSLHKLNGVWKVSSLLLSTPNSDSCDPRVALGWTAPGCCQPQKVCHSNFYLYIISQIYCIFVYTSKGQKDHVSTTVGSKILVPRTVKKKENNIVIVGWSSSS